MNLFGFTRPFQFCARAELTRPNYRVLMKIPTDDGHIKFG